jgi:uncharacterized protein YabE (DUF348 family)
MQRKFQRQYIRLLHYRRVRLPKHVKRLKVASKHPYAVPFFTFGVLLIVCGAAYVLAKQTDHIVVVPTARIVIISHDHEQQVVPTRDATVGQLLKRLKIQIGQGDVVEPSTATAINQDQFRINIYRAVPVEIIDGTQRTFTYSAATTPRAIATQTGKALYNDDIVTTDPVTNFIKTGAIGEQVVINRATPVDVNLYGTPTTIRTHAATVGALIKQKGIHLASDDQVIPSEATPITAGAQVFIVRNGTKIESVTQTIPMPVQTINDASLAYGTSAVRQQGSNGQQVITYQDTLKNGVVVAHTQIQAVTTQSTVTEIVVVGTSLSGIKGDMALAGIEPSDYNYADYIISHESGWCPTKAQGEHTCPPIPDDSMTSAGYGLCQATPGYKMASDGADWATNPVTQLRWCSGYAHSRYGSWYNAYVHWMDDHNW